MAHHLLFRKGNGMNSNQEKRILIECLERDMSGPEIAKHMGISKSTVYNKLAEYSLKTKGAAYFHQKISAKRMMKNKLPSLIK